MPRLMAEQELTDAAQKAGECTPICAWRRAGGPDVRLQAQRRRCMRQRYGELRLDAAPQ